MSIIGIIGFAGSGKSTVGDYLIEKHGYMGDSFAKPLKDVVASVFGWPRHLLEGDTLESRAWREKPDEWWEKQLDWNNNPSKRISERFTPRVALQLWGTEVCRSSFHDSIWIMSLKYRLKGASKTVITDCRFPNEIAAIREMGGKVIRVKRGPDPVWFNYAVTANGGDTPQSTKSAMKLDELGIHRSEWSWIGYPVDYVIRNDGTLEELEEQIECFLNQD